MAKVSYKIVTKFASKPQILPPNMGVFFHVDKLAFEVIFMTFSLQLFGSLVWPYRKNSLPIIQTGKVIHWSALETVRRLNIKKNRCSEIEHKRAYCRNAF